MSKLLDVEEEDEFYKTTYGGFNDVRILIMPRCLFVQPCDPINVNSVLNTHGKTQVTYICPLVCFMLTFCCFLMQESGDDEYKGDHSDSEDEVDSDFDIDEGDEPDSEQEEDAPRRKSRVVTKAYKVTDNISLLM